MVIAALPKNLIKFIKIDMVLNFRFLEHILMFNIFYIKIFKRNKIFLKYFHRFLNIF